MGKTVEDIPFESACIDICLSKNWLDKYITKMKIHGCTMLVCMGEALFDIDALEEILHDLPLWVEELIMMKMDAHILYGSPRKGLCSSIYWMVRYITYMITKGCEILAHIDWSFLCICSRFLDAYNIVIVDEILTSECIHLYILCIIPRCLFREASVM